MPYTSNGHIGLAAEPAFGSATAATDHIEALSEDMKLDFDRFQFKNIINTIAEPDDAAGIRRPAGPLVFAAHPISIGYALKGDIPDKLHEYSQVWLPVY